MSTLLDPDQVGGFLTKASGLRVFLFLAPSHLTSILLIPICLARHPRSHHYPPHEQLEVGVVYGMSERSMVIKISEEIVLPNWFGSY